MNRSRDAFMQKLREFDVDSRPYFYPLSAMSDYPGTNTPVTLSGLPDGD